MSSSTYYSLLRKRLAPYLSDPTNEIFIYFEWYATPRVLVVGNTLTTTQNAISSVSAYIFNNTRQKELLSLSSFTIAYHGYFYFGGNVQYSEGVYELSEHETEVDADTNLLLTNTIFIFFLRRKDVAEQFVGTLTVLVELKPNSNVSGNKVIGKIYVDTKPDIDKKYLDLVNSLCEKLCIAKKKNAQ